MKRRTIVFPPNFGKIAVQKKLHEQAVKIAAAELKEKRNLPVSHYIPEEITRDFDEYYFGGEFAELCIELCEAQKNPGWQAWKR